MTERETAPAVPPESAAAPRLVLATTNQGKLAELTRILVAAGVVVRLAGLDDFPGAPAIRETGATFTENALLKARAIAEFSGLPTVAEDSGLCADALNGMPAVLSARWSGRGATDQSNLRLLLEQLADVPDARRGAHFSCVAALVLPGGREQISEGSVSGRLIREPRGRHGFGYDPVFVPDPVQLTEVGVLDAGGLTMAEMRPAAKDAISHRGRALRVLAPVIGELLG
jgi:XTP/dITP diphosphohydrolase